MRSFWGIVLGSGWLALAACATGNDVSATFSAGGGGGAGQGGAGEGASSVEASTSTSEAASSSASSGTSSGTSTGAGGSGAGGSGCDFSTEETCAMATEITSIDGDQNSDTRTVKGTTSAWYMVQVKEASLLIKQVSYTATLVSPPGMVFKLFAYTGDATMLDCLGEAEPGVGNPPSVTGIWPDNFGPDDSAWISLEVRYISGDVCDPALQWTLTVQGHTNP
jgi:hypothetical protein